MALLNIRFNMPKADHINIGKLELFLWTFVLPMKPMFPPQQVSIAIEDLSKASGTWWAHFGP